MERARNSKDSKHGEVRASGKSNEGLREAQNSDKTPKINALV